MSRLVVVSNRVADIERPAQSGGLAVAVADALKAAGGLWFGWDGRTVEDGTPMELVTKQADNVLLATVPLTERDYDEYYLGFSNKVLWPICHYRLDLAEFEAAFVDGYRRVNQRMADQLVNFLRPDDTIWIHDYHLFPLASELRARGQGQRIGFFLHIPFPPPDVLTALPDHEWLFRSIFSYDVVGFQTSVDLANFQRYATDQADGSVAGDAVRAYGREIVARAFPIGIDVDSFIEMATTPAASALIEQLHRRTLARSHIIGVERLDYTKGLAERFKAFRLLLEKYPENRKAVTLMQIAPPTREQVTAYADIREELERLSGAINGEYGDFDWTPVRYVHRTVARDNLAGLFRGSEVGLVTPLRDGMNLVAKEYVAAQDPENPGVLVLSQFAGAAEDLEEAIIVNPYGLEDVAEAMQTALTMRLEERIERHQALLKRVRQRDVANWRRQFLAALSGNG